MKRNERVPLSKQTGNTLVVSIVVGSVLLIAAAVIYVIATAPPANPRFTPLRELSDQTVSQWQGTLRCSALAQYGAFERPREVLVTDTMVAVETGEPGAFLEIMQAGPSAEAPERLDAEFEWLRGQVTDGEVVVEGWYTEGDDVVKSVSMKGKISEDGLSVKGTRGPRICVLEAAPASAS